MSDSPLLSASLLAAQSAGTGKAPAPRPTADAAAARRTAEEFEAVFLAQMLEYMVAGLDTAGPFGGGHGEEVFRSLLTQEYGRSMARAGGVGFADAVQREILRLQEVE
ncbi:MAG: rod-binding protein [Alphaproteobacteria bacterium]|nr:rod-binding protein [Alphaproteobacteria bacterium]